MPATGIFELAAITGGTGRVISTDVLALVDVLDATQAAQGSLIKITVAQLYRTEFTPVTVSTPLPDIAQTWNAGAITFTAVKLNVTDTASAAASLLLDLQVGGVSKFSVRKDGTITVGSIAVAASALTGTTLAANVVTSSLTSVGTLTSLAVTGLITANAGILIATGGSVAAGTIVKDTVVFGAFGLVISGITGATSDLTLMTPSTTTIMTVPTGTRNVLLAGTLALSTAASKIVPGATSISLRNNADNADNLIVLDNGNTTVRGTLTVTGAFTQANLTLTAATSKIVPGATSLSLRNNADAADNILILDNGNTTIRGTLTLSATLTSGTGNVRVGASTAGVSTSATTIFTATSASVGCAVIVFGSDGTNSFVETVYFQGGGTAVPTTGNVLGSPAARTYSVSANALKVAMASGTYTIKTMPMELT